GIWVGPAQTSTYVVRQEICGVVRWDTVVVYSDGVGLYEQLSASIRLWPNPVNRFLEIETTGLSGYDFEVSDQTGRLLMMGRLPEGIKIHTLELNLLPGLYYFTCKSQELMIIRKFVVTGA